MESKSLGLFVRRGEDPWVNGRWREWISWRVREKRHGRKDLGDQGCLASCFRFNKYLLFSFFVGGDIRNTGPNLQTKVGDTGPLEV